MRKTFARRIHAAALGDINVTRPTLGYRSVTTTESYLSEDADLVARLIAGLGENAA